MKADTETFKFTFKRIKPTELELKTDERTFVIGIFEDSEKEDMIHAIEDFVDYELIENADCVTGSEVVGFKYNEETNTGEFEVNIFFE